MSDETSKKAEPIYKVLPSEFGLAEHQIRQHCVTARAGTPFEAFRSNPATWAHIAGKLSDGDIIHVRTRDCAYYARLYVLTVHKQAAKVHVLEYLECPRAVITGPNEYIVEWGGRHKWRVMRTSDRAVMEHGFASEAEAVAHANELNKQLAA
jgi:hypothetical protein